MTDLISGVAEPLNLRSISQATCQHFGYLKGTYNGRTVQIAPYFDADGSMVAQKLRGADKAFKVLGDISAALPFGAQSFPKTGLRVVVTEGEIDALSVSQVQDNKWPVVSIPNGAQGAKKHFAKNLEYYQGFAEVVLMFDTDEPGRAAAIECAAVLGSRAKIAELPLPYKDANDMLVAGRVQELISAIWKAKKYRPDGIVTIADIAEDVLSTIPRGKDFAFREFTDLIYGRRDGEVWAVAAGVGAGKTSFLLQDAEHTAVTLDEPVGLFFLETPPREVALRMSGILAGKAYHVPDGSWTNEQLSASLATLQQNNRVFIYDSFGMTEWDRVRDRIRYLHHEEGVKYFIVDNLTCFAAGAEDERKLLDSIAGEAASLMQELQSFMWLVSHLATPEGKPHENGGEIMLRHIKGSRGISAFLHGAVGLERNQQDEIESERDTVTVRIIKSRYIGRANGKKFKLRYDHSTTLLTQPAIVPMFVDESKGSDF